MIQTLSYQHVQTVLKLMTLQHVLVLMAGHLMTQISVYLLVKTIKNIMTLTMYVLANTAGHLTEQVSVCQIVLQIQFMLILKLVHVITQQLV